MLKMIRTVGLAIAASIAFSSEVLATAVNFSENFLAGETQHFSDAVQSGNIGNTAVGTFAVTKSILNLSGFQWNAFNVTLQTSTNEGTTWIPSPEDDGISFNQVGATPAEWASAFKVFINGIQQVTGFGVARTDSPNDFFQVVFYDFHVMPGQTLGLAFDMSENLNNLWRLDQVVAIPEPQTYALMMAGLLMLGFMARRRMGQ